MNETASGLMKRITIVEVGGSHAECLYSQILFLKKNGCYVTLICNLEFKQHVSSIVATVDDVVYVSAKRANSWLHALAVRRQIVNSKPEKVILNTAQSGLTKRMMLLPYPKSIQFMGILHNLKKLYGSLGQRIISRKVKKYFVLSEYLVEKIPGNVENKLDFEVFYPIYFPKVDSAGIEKPDDEIWICVPGQVSQRRRDYLGLIEALSKHKLNNNVKFLLLGRMKSSESDNKELMEFVGNSEFKNVFKYWEEFVDEQTYVTYLEKSDYILPLIHEGTTSAGLYNYQISGAFNLAIGYKKPLLMEDTFARHSEFGDSAFFYEKGKLIELVNSLNPHRDIKTFETKRWDFEHQYKKYITFLNR